MDIRRAARFMRVTPYIYIGWATDYDIEDVEYRADDIAFNWADYKSTIKSFMADMEGCMDGDTPDSMGMWKIVVDFATAENDEWVPMVRYEKYLDEYLDEME